MTSTPKPVTLQPTRYIVLHPAYLPAICQSSSAITFMFSISQKVIRYVGKDVSALPILFRVGNKKLNIMN